MLTHQFFRQSKRDLQSADEYYSRAILADPKDGEILSQYAKLVWELHHDQDRASSYFERAVQASPKDRYVLIPSNKKILYTLGCNFNFLGPSTWYVRNCHTI
jgi:tetratricopeptide (TPR) repeat protein